MMKKLALLIIVFTACLFSAYGQIGRAFQNGIRADTLRTINEDTEIAVDEIIAGTPVTADTVFYLTEDTLNWYTFNLGHGNVVDSLDFQVGAYLDVYYNDEDSIIPRILHGASIGETGDAFTFIGYYDQTGFDDGSSSTFLTSTELDYDDGDISVTSFSSGIPQDAWWWLEVNTLTGNRPKYAAVNLGITVLGANQSGTTPDPSPTPIDYLAYYKFDGDLTDEAGENDGSAVGTITYQGDTALIFSTSEGDDFVNIGDLIPASSDALTIAYEIYLNEGAVNENYYAWGNNTSPSGAVGMTSFFDGTGSGTFNASHRATDLTGGTTSDIATTVSSGCHSTTLDDTWYSVVEIWSNLDDDASSGNGHVVTYINGTCCQCSGTPDSITYEQVPGTYDGQDWVIGNYRSTGSSTGLREGALIDEFKIFVGDIRREWGENYIDSLDNNPYRIPYQ